MKQFSFFTQKYGEGQFIQPLSNDSMRYDNFPAIMREALTSSGYRWYLNHFLEVIDPFDYKDIVSLLKMKNDIVSIFCRTAFGDLFIWDKKNIYLYEVNFGKFMQITNSFETFFDYFLENEKNLIRFLNYHLYVHYLKNDSSLIKEDECLGFFPALLLGGPQEVANLKKVKLREYLLIQINLLQ